MLMQRKRLNDWLTNQLRLTEKHRQRVVVQGDWSAVKHYQLRHTVLQFFLRAIIGRSDAGFVDLVNRKAWQQIVKPECMLDPIIVATVATEIQQIVNHSH